MAVDTVNTLHHHAGLVEAMTDAVVATDAEFRVTIWNAAAERLYGYTEDEAIGRFARDLVTGDAQHEIESTLARTGHVQRDFRARRTTGERVDVQLIATAVRDDAGVVVGYFGIHRDVTQPRRGDAGSLDSMAAEPACERQGRQQAAIAELGVRASDGVDAVALMEEAVATVSRTLGVLVAIAERVEGGERLVLRAGVGWDANRAGERTDVDARSMAAYAVRTGEPFVSYDVAREGRCAPSPWLADERVTSAAVVPIPGRDAPFGALGVFSRTPRRFDATEVNFLRAIANVLYGAIERAKLAERVNQARTAERRRIARALHDETLQELGLALARAAREVPPDDGLVAALQRVGEQIRSAVDDLRLDDERDLPFPQLVERLVATHRSAASNCDFTLELIDVPVRLAGDMGTHVLRIIGEALTNARRHAAPRHVEVRLFLAEGELVVWVTDDGCGLGPQRMRPGGGGNGITGMHERAKLLAGQLEVARRAGGGTTVELRVPLADAPVTCARVLLVDDHTAIREALALAFTQDDGFVVRGQAGSLAEARTMLDGVDVAVVDLTLPDGDGTDLIAELRTAGADAQAVVLTAHVDRATTARAVDSGAAAVLSKTTHLHEVVTAVRRLRAGETLIALEEMVELLRFASRQRAHEQDQRRRIERLTPREREVLQLMADGLDGRRAAARLYISPRTQRNHVANILTKLGVHSQLQALVFALRHGLVTSEPAPE